MDSFLFFNSLTPVCFLDQPTKLKVKVLAVHLQWTLVCHSGTDDCHIARDWIAKHIISFSYFFFVRGVTTDQHGHRKLSLFCHLFLLPQNSSILLSRAIYTLSCNYIVRHRCEFTTRFVYIFLLKLYLNEWYRWCIVVLNMSSKVRKLNGKNMREGL